MKIADLFRDDEGGPRIFWHWQNLNEDRDGHVKGSGLRHGRGYVQLWNATLRAEWVVPSGRFQLGWRVSTDAEDVVTVQACVPPVGLYFGVESWPASKALAKAAKEMGWKTREDWGGFKREVSLRVFDWAAWWTIWRNPDHGSPRDPRQRSWHPFGHLGSRIGDAEVRERREVGVPMPEKTYRAIATRTVITTRGTPRWPFSRPRLSRVELDFQPFDPVPVPGKGENSWDCDEDATYSSSVAAETIEEAIGEMVASTLRTRLRRGGANWKPEAKAEKVPA